jgi:hypothetical protein
MMNSKSVEDRDRVAFPRPLRVFLYVDLSLLAIAIVSEVFCRFVLHLSYPYRFPLLNEHYLDLVNLQARFRYFGTVTFFTDTKDPYLMYPAPIAMVYRFFFFFAPHHVAAFLSFVGISFLAATALFGRLLIRHGLRSRETWLFLGTVLLTSYPLAFEVRQANMEIVSWILVTLGVSFFLVRRSYPAAVCFGIAGTLKVFPFLYLGLLLTRRQYRQIIAGFVAAVAVTIPSLWVLDSNILESWSLTELALNRFRTFIMIQRHEPQTSFDHSIFGFIKVLLRHLPPPPTMSLLLSTYLAIAVVFVLVLYFFRIRLLPLTNQVLCLCILSILLPPTSFDYTLMHLYAPWAMLVLVTLESARKGSYPKGLVKALVCFAILFVPETEVIFGGVSVGGQIKALVLIVLLVIAVRYPFPSQDLAGESSDASTGSPIPLPERV